ncbi:MAG: hypothetical protein LBQ54_13405 [Planctomycetaceae bacterium]|nr:hypothetical protein [Planctomycetaceae bacterium]
MKRFGIFNLTCIAILAVMLSRHFVLADVAPPPVLEQVQDKPPHNKTKLNDSQLVADISPIERGKNFSESFRGTVILVGVVIFVIVVFSGICLFLIIKKSKKQEPPSTPLKSETDSDTAVETTQNETDA